MPKPIYTKLATILFFFIAFPSLVSAEIYINEIMYDLSGTETGREWIEIYNAGSDTIDLSSWKFFEGNVNHSLNNISGGNNISAGGYAIISDDSSKFLIDWPNFSGILFDSAFSLNNTGESLSLKDSNQVVVNEVIYDTSIGANGDGNSLQKSGSSWITGLPTPGAINTSEVASSTATSTDSTEDTTDDSEETEEASSTTPSSPDSPSVHYGSSSLSTKKSQVNFSLSAGRNRLGSAGSPLEFKADTDLNYTNNTIFKWNFGDGTEGVGDVLSHTYEYSGDYVVVLNASIGSTGQVTARVDVKIIDPELVIISADPEKIEVKNNSKYEVSLFGKALVYNQKNFVFSQDTIIKPGHSISFSSKITGLKPDNNYAVSLFSIGENRNELVIAKKIEHEKSIQIASLQNQIESLRNQIASARVSEAPVLPMVASEVSSSSPTSAEPMLSFKASEEISTQDALVSKGWFEVLRRFFFRDYDR